MVQDVKIQYYDIGKSILQFLFLFQFSLFRGNLSYWDTRVILLLAVVKRSLVVQGAAEITPTFWKITVGSPKQAEGCGPFH
jgi:hypothetical protein